MLDGPLDTLVKLLATLPGLGSRSAKRIALYLLTHKDGIMIPLSKILSETAEKVRTCNICGNLDMAETCRVCRDPARDRQTICVISSVADLWAVERTGSYNGQYHVLGGVLSALDGIGPDNLTIDALIRRMKEDGIQEVILALSATVDGQSTAHYISDKLHEYDVKTTRLARGVPVGGELDYLDDGTISTAMKSRA